MTKIKEERALNKRAQKSEFSSVYQGAKNWLLTLSLTIQGSSGGITGGASRSIHGSLGGFTGESSCLSIVITEHPYPLLVGNLLATTYAHLEQEYHHKYTITSTNPLLYFGEYKYPNNDISSQH